MLPLLLSVALVVFQGHAATHHVTPCTLEAARPTHRPHPTPTSRYTSDVTESSAATAVQEIYLLSAPQAILQRVFQNAEDVCGRF
ncbi:hypothetical protein O3P69_008034 [Scylla paramamosain]|uniref:Secreted protein n=1 Tax=Scylla paramamosain TaxID=85552 RepID=A0AAW0T0T0_SCYPA